MFFSVDGIVWNIPCDIVRVPNIRKSNISGMMLDGTIFNDYVGTYMAYEVKLVPNPYQLDKYYTLYEILTSPKDHDFVFPYDGVVVSFRGSVEEPEDIYRIFGNTRTWIGNRFNVQASMPTKDVNLSEIIAHGLPVTPEGMPASEGDVYEYESGAWVPLELVNGDEIGW